MQTFFQLTKRQQRAPEKKKKNPKKKKKKTGGILMQPSACPHLTPLPKRAAFSVARTNDSQHY